MKEAVFRYIDSKKIDVIELLPLYQYYSDKYINHSYTTPLEGEVDLTDRYEGGYWIYLCKTASGTTPLYEYYSEKYVNHSYCTNWGYYFWYRPLSRNIRLYLYIAGSLTTPLDGYYSKKVY